MQSYRALRCLLKELASMLLDASSVCNKRLQLDALRKEDRVYSRDTVASISGPAMRINSYAFEDMQP